eukprot:scaffold9372_cov35-Prasinocladus_malaysianus.AAC.1
MNPSSILRQMMATGLLLHALPGIGYDHAVGGQLPVQLACRLGSDSPGSDGPGRCHWRHHAHLLLLLQGKMLLLQALSPRIQ